MTRFLRLMAAEGLKVRRSAVLRMVWLLPFLFVGLEFLGFERPLLGIRQMAPGLRSFLEFEPLKLVVTLWAGFFQPMALALLPALLFRPEHRGKTWNHLHAMPMPRRSFFLAKAASALLLSAGMLVVLGLLLLLERRALGSVNPLLALPGHGLTLFRILAWLWLGSLPVLAIYLWVADRIPTLAVSVVFGLLGLLLTITLTGQELDHPWRRDLNPWVLPYAAAERVVHQGPGQQNAHVAGQLFQKEPNVMRLPSGRKVHTWQNIPDEVISPPPPPTPAWLLATFSAGAGLLLLALGWLDAGRPRR
jgi:hypothetical protein